MHGSRKIETATLPVPYRSTHTAAAHAYGANRHYSLRPKTIEATFCSILLGDSHSEEVQRAV
ncbi:MAG: hypothetical protein QNJ68_13070 [Microcoleaceae cyanobacterium MO_207.B10]|nr:hypothetical protein [Microcoleaceae cyanobacterium MO_207.B10]